MEEDDEFVIHNVADNGLNLRSERAHHKQHQKSVLVNLSVFAFVTLLLTIAFMFTLAKKSKEIQEVILPFHNPTNRSQLLCPPNTSFNPFELTCKRCSTECTECYHGFERMCTKCNPGWNLLGSECVQSCTGRQGVGVCLLDKNDNYSTVELGTQLMVRNGFYIGIHNYSTEQLIIVIPPLGETHMFLQLMNYTELTHEMNATVVIMSTPIEQVVQMHDEHDVLDAQQELFHYVETIGIELGPAISIAKTVRIVTFHNMLFFGHELSHLMQTLWLYSLQNQVRTMLGLLTLPIQEIPDLNPYYISLVLAYVQGRWDIKHTDNVNLPIENKQPDDFAQMGMEYLSATGFNKLFMPAQNRQVDITAYIEQGSPDLQDMYRDFQGKSFKQMKVQLEGSEMGKLAQLFYEIMRE